MRSTLRWSSMVILVVGASLSFGIQGGGAREQGESDIVVFLSDRRYNGPEIYVMRSDGADQRRLPNAYGRLPKPRISPDGTRIAYSALRFETPRGGIYVTSPDGRYRRRLTSKGESEWSPAWSPDGRQLVFVAAAARPVRYGLYVMRADGTRRRRIVQTASRCVDRPDFSPSGARIAYQTGCSPHERVFVVTLATKRRVPLTRARASAPAWSPDGARVAYITGASLRIMEVSTRRETIVAGVTVHRGSTITWSADGRFILFAMDEPSDVHPDEDVAHIFRVRLDDLTLTRLTRSGGGDFNPDWP